MPLWICKQASSTLCLCVLYSTVSLCFLSRAQSFRSYLVSELNHMMLCLGIWSYQDSMCYKVTEQNSHECCTWSYRHCAWWLLDHSNSTRPWHWRFCSPEYRGRTSQGNLREREEEGHYVVTTVPCSQIKSHNIEDNLGLKETSWKKSHNWHSSFPSTSHLHNTKGDMVIVNRQHFLSI